VGPRRSSRSRPALFPGWPLNYLGQTTWASLCERLGIDFTAFPETLTDALTTHEGRAIDLCAQRRAG
jgi:hypothetical protein